MCTTVFLPLVYISKWNGILVAPLTSNGAIIQEYSVHMYLILTPSMFCDNHCQSLVFLFFPLLHCELGHSLLLSKSVRRVQSVQNSRYKQTGELWAWSWSWHIHKQQHYTAVHERLLLHPLGDHSSLYYDLCSLCMLSIMCISFTRVVNKAW